MSHSLVLIVTELSHYGYVALFFIVLVGGTYVPIPAGIALIAVGALSRQHYFNFVLSFFVAIAASVVSDLITYFIAKHFGKNRRVHERFIDRHPLAKRVEQYTDRHPRASILLSRFIGFASTPVNALAGLRSMPLDTFLPYDLLGNTICVLIYLIAGYFIGAAWEQDAKTTSTIIGVVLAVAVIGYLLVFTFLNRCKQS